MRESKGGNQTYNAQTNNCKTIAPSFAFNIETAKATQLCFLECYLSQKKEYISSALNELQYLEALNPHAPLTQILRMDIEDLSNILL